MRTFSLTLRDTTQIERIDNVVSFVGEDASGSFGILAGHVRMMTSLVFGMARFRLADNTWQYLALPGGILYFVDNNLSVSTRHYLIDTELDRISVALREQILTEDKALRELKTSLHTMEEALLKRLWEMERERDHPK